MKKKTKQPTTEQVDELVEILETMEAAATEQNKTNPSETTRAHLAIIDILKDNVKRIFKL